MRFGKVIPLLRELDEPTHRKFSQYLQSPYFNVPFQAVSLYNYLRSIHGSFPPKYLLPEAVAKAQPDIKEKGQQDKGAYYLRVALKDFLAVQSLLNDQNLFTLHTLNALSYRHWFSWYEQEYKEAEKRMTPLQTGGLDYYHYHHYLTEAKFNGFYAKVLRPEGDNINEVIDTLDTYHAVKKLRYLCEAYNRYNWSGQHKPPYETAPLLATLQPHNTVQHPYIHLFVTALQMLMQSSYTQARPYYLQVKKQVLQNRSKPLPPHVVEVVDYLQSHCLRGCNAGITEAYTEYLWCIEWKIAHHLFSVRGGIEPLMFANLFAVAFKAKHPPVKITRLVKALSPLLPAEHRPAKTLYARAVALYAEGRCADAAALFTNAEKDSDPVFTCILKRWGFMSSFDSRPWGKGLDAQLDALERYLQRHPEIPENIRQAFYRFTAAARQLLKSPLKIERKKLKQQLAKQDYFPWKEWVEEKLG